MTSVMKVLPLVVNSLVCTIISCPEKLKKSVSGDERLMVQSTFGHIAEKECLTSTATIVVTVSSIFTSAKVKGSMLSLLHGQEFTKIFMRSMILPPGPKLMPMMGPFSGIEVQLLQLSILFTIVSV